MHPRTFDSISGIGYTHGALRLRETAGDELLHAAEFTPGERRVLVLNVSVVLAFSGFESIALVLRQVMQILERQHNVRVPSLDE